MPLALDLEKDQYQPVYLGEYDIYRYLTFSTTIYAFVYVARFRNDYVWIDPSMLSGSWKLAAITGIGSIKTDSGFLTKASSIAEVIANRESFFWDAEARACYIHLQRGASPRLFTTLVGEIFGIRKGGTEEYYNDIEYPDLIESIPSMSRSKTNFFNAKNTNEGGNIVIRNEDAAFDKLTKNTTVLGNAFRLFIGMVNYGYRSFELLYSGYIRKITTTTKTIVFGIKDNLDKLQIPIPGNRYTLMEYPYLNDSNDGKIIPYIYGKRRNFPVMCVNETEPAATVFRFRIGDMTFYDAIIAVPAVYRYIDKEKTDVTAHATIDLLKAEITLPATYYTPGQDVTVDYEGYAYNDDPGVLIENALDIIKELIVNHTRANDTALYFNTAKWDRDIAFSVIPEIDEETTVEKVIEQITGKGTLANFQIDDDGRYSCKIFDPAAAVDLVLQDHEVLSIGPIVSDQAKLVSELVIKYDKDAKAETFRTIVNMDYLAENKNLYETYQQKIIETIIRTPADAAAFGVAFQAIYGIPDLPFDVETTLIACRLKVSDIVQMELKRPKAPNRGTWKNEVLKRTNNYDGHRVSLTLRPFAEVGSG
jgi:hypothetical protein